MVRKGWHWIHCYRSNREPITRSHQSPSGPNPDRHGSYGNQADTATERGKWQEDRQTDRLLFSSLHLLCIVTFYFLPNFHLLFLFILMGHFLPFPLFHVYLSDPLQSSFFVFAFVLFYYSIVLSFVLIVFVLHFLYFFSCSPTEVQRKQSFHKKDKWWRAFYPPNQIQSRPVWWKTNLAILPQRLQCPV